MSDSPCACESCGASLPSADAVCAACEATLTARPPSPPLRYVCPHCEGRFAGPVQALWPPRQPWWRPTKVRLQCPQCETPLRDGHRRPAMEALVLLALGMPALLLQSETRHPWRGLGLALVIAGYALYGFAVHRRASRDPHRYRIGTHKAWLRDARDLGPPPGRRSGDGP
ncbi:hypothetical protein DBR42_25715 [Pelomonas sp. HMWF004]|nr:hypothetical protein DBR42_25715 [Pelomonas sp. HMWF004]